MINAQFGRLFGLAARWLPAPLEALALLWLGALLLAVLGWAAWIAIAISARLLNRALGGTASGVGALPQALPGLSPLDPAARNN